MCLLRFVCEEVVVFLGGGVVGLATETEERERDKELVVKKRGEERNTIHINRGWRG